MTKATEGNGPLIFDKIISAFFLDHSEQIKAFLDKFLIWHSTLASFKGHYQKFSFRLSRPFKTYVFMYICALHCTLHCCLFYPQKWMDKNFFALDMELGTGRIQEVGICF